MPLNPAVWRTEKGQRKTATGGQEMRCFLSYNKADKEVARSIGAHMVLTGIEVWFDEWEIQAGDSIPGKLNEGLSAFDAFVLLWSADANRSNWVRQELHTAIMSATKGGSSKIVPCLLDKTQLPPLISDRRGIDFRDLHKGIDELLGHLTGTRSRRQRLLAIQAALQEMDVDWITHPALPPMVCCPKCGETETLKGWEQISERGDLYRGMKCTSCGWSDGAEM
ncbi:MAG: toll/interleukin-1 receptor domain-containing protein [Syntrophobacteraceae bacterium]